jgi:prephenate dehydrogenase
MPDKLKIGKLVVVGVGLIGGSFALALKRARAVKHVVGVGRTARNLAAALRLKAIDEALQDPARAVRDADLVLLAMPVGQMPAVMARIAPHLSEQAVVTDAGSTKRDVIACARRLLGAHFARFVPAHPIAGTENSGAAAAFGELFRNRTVIFTPQRETAAAAVKVARGAWETCGARVVRLDAAEHDAIFAKVSHLPHVIAFALVDMLARCRNARQLFGFSGGGLRDTVRIAGSSPEMWADVCIANRDTLLAALEGYEDELEQVRAMIESGDGEALKALFGREGRAGGGRVGCVLGAHQPPPREVAAETISNRQEKQEHRNLNRRETERGKICKIHWFCESLCVSVVPFGLCSCLYGNSWRSWRLAYSFQAGFRCR